MEGQIQYVHEKPLGDFDDFQFDPSIGDIIFLSTPTLLSATSLTSIPPLVCSECEDPENKHRAAARRGDLLYEVALKEPADAIEGALPPAASI